MTPPRPQSLSWAAINFYRRQAEEAQAEAKAQRERAEYLELSLAHALEWLERLGQLPLDTQPKA